MLGARRPGVGTEYSPASASQRAKHKKGAKKGYPLGGERGTEAAKGGKELARKKGRRGSNSAFS